jgi:hypothetical protein
MCKSPVIKRDYSLRMKSGILGPPSSIVHPASLHCPGVTVGPGAGVAPDGWVAVIVSVAAGGAIGAAVGGAASGVSVALGSVGCGVGGRRNVTVTFGGGSASVTPGGS